MPLIDFNRNPTRRQLKWFAILLPLFFAVIGAVHVFVRGHSPQTWSIVVAVAAAVSLLGALSPTFLRYAYLGWMMLLYPIGFVISHLVMALVFYLVITPVGLMMRLCGRDPMHRRFDPSATTYWIPRDDETNTERYLRQY